MEDKSSIEVSSLSAIDHVLRYRPRKIKKLQFFVSRDKLSDRQHGLAKLAESNGIIVEYAGKGKVDRQAESVRAILHPYDYTEFKPFLSRLEEKERGIVLVLDHIQDPQNLGALARTAEALGVLGIFLPRDRGVLVTGGAYNASVGAVETIPIVDIHNVADGLRRLKEVGFWIVGSSLGENSKPLEETPSFEKVAIVLGTEWEGMSQLVEKTCDWVAHIPLKGKIQSLNVSAAGAILMHHFAKSNPK